MRLRIDTSGTRFIVTRAPEPRLNFETGAPKVDTATGMPMYAPRSSRWMTPAAKYSMSPWQETPKLQSRSLFRWLVWWPSRGPKVIAAGWRSALMPSPPPPPVVLRRVSRHARRSNPKRVWGAVNRSPHPATPGIAVDHTLTEGISHDIEQ